MWVWVVMNLLILLAGKWRVAALMFIPRRKPSLSTMNWRRRSWENWVTRCSERGRNVRKCESPVLYYIDVWLILLINKYYCVEELRSASISSLPAHDQGVMIFSWALSSVLQEYKLHSLLIHAKASIIKFSSYFCSYIWNWCIVGCRCFSVAAPTLCNRLW